MGKTYTVTAERGGSGVWVLECVELGVVSQTRRLAHAAEEMREAMAYQAGISSDEINVAVEVILPANISELKARAEMQREQAEKLAAEAQQSARDVALAMKKDGMTVRDMGEILGVSYQRAQKLAAL